MYRPDQGGSPGLVLCLDLALPAEFGSRISDPRRDPAWPPLTRQANPHGRMPRGLLRSRQLGPGCEGRASVPLSSTNIFDSMFDPFGDRSGPASGVSMAQPSCKPPA
jgi:hypothetical protein